MEDGQYSLLLCNDLGTPVDSRYLDIGENCLCCVFMCISVFLLYSIEPLYACISHTHIAVATRNVIYTWHYRTTSRLATSEVAYTILRKGREGKEMLLHIDEIPVDGGDHTIDNSKIAIEKVGLVSIVLYLFMCMPIMCGYIFIDYL